MQVEILQDPSGAIAIVTGEEILLTDGASALDLMMTIRYEAGAEKIAFDKQVVAEDFFILNTGLAGEILQKVVNYHMKFAVYGDFSRYKSKPLRDFIYESNQGRNIFFADTKEHAIELLRAF